LRARLVDTFTRRATIRAAKEPIMQSILGIAHDVAEVAVLAVGAALLLAAACILV